MTPDPVPDVLGDDLPQRPPAGLGRLGPALLRLAAAQGTWPPRRPRRVVVAEPTGGLEGGRRAADALVDGGADLVVLPGADDPEPALVVLAALLGLEPVEVVGTTGAPGWARLVAEVRDGLRTVRPHVAVPERVLEELGDEHVGALAGLLQGCAARHTPVLLSGACDVWAGALVADRIAADLRRWLLPGVSPARTATAAAVSALRADPLLDLRLDAPAGADLALGVLLAGVGLAAGA